MPARRIAVADCETDPFERYRIPAPFVWGVYDGLRFWLFRTTREFIEFVSEQNWILFAHNGGRFDWHFILDYIPARDFPEIMIINGRIARFRIGKCEFRDSFSILPVPLAAYKKDEIDYAIMEADVRYHPANWEKICDYLRSDCVYLYELIDKFMSKYDRALTIAGASMKLWKRVSGKPLPSTDQSFYDAIFPYYYGGRVECFEKGIIHANFSVYDINSAYPRAMLEAHPYSTSYGACDGFERTADFYTLRAHASGALPYRASPEEARMEGSGQGALSFPNDGIERTFHITKWEFQAALEYGLVSPDDVIRSIYFDEHIDFREYIEPLYESRLIAKAAKDDAQSLFDKLFMNSLYGKFAANPENYDNYMICEMRHVAGLEAAGWTFAGPIGPYALAKAPLAEHQKRYYNIATAASITGYVRAQLWRAMRESTGVLYCDTDSIACRTFGTGLQVADALGAWKLEGVYKRAGIAGKKLYIFEPAASNDWRAAGLAEKDRGTKKATKGARLTDVQVWEVASDPGNVVTYVPEAPTLSALSGVMSPGLSDAERVKRAFTPRRIRMTKLKRLSRLRALHRRNVSRQLELNFSAQLTQSAQSALDLSEQ